MSLVWPTVVQLVVSFNSGLRGGLAKRTLSLFRHSDRFDLFFVVVFFAEMQLIELLPLCEPNFLCRFFIFIFIYLFILFYLFFFCIENYIGTQGDVCTVKGL